jgi:hypothetical protein
LGLHAIGDDPAQRDGLVFHFISAARAIRGRGRRGGARRSPRRRERLPHLVEHVAIGALQAAAHSSVGKTAMCPFWRSLPSVTQTGSGNFLSFAMRKRPDGD